MYVKVLFSSSLVMGVTVPSSPCLAWILSLWGR